MRLLGRVAALFGERETAFALIGAAALAVHGVTRSTRDIDVLVADPVCLDPSYWAPLRQSGTDVSVRSGTPDDPLAGVVRLRTSADTVDVIVGRPAWQRVAIGRAVPAVIEGVDVPVVRPADLVLLKLYAGGPMDMWDIEQLLGSLDAADIAAEVDRHVAELPEDARALWQRVRQRPT